MLGQMTIYDYLKPETCQIKRSRFTDWQTVNITEALEFVHKKWDELKGVRESYRADYINDYLVKGYEFTEEEIRKGGM